MEHFAGVILEITITKYLKYKTLIWYLVFGSLTTLVNIIIYISLTKLFGIQYLISNTAAWMAAVLFAYVTNRLFVFASKGEGAAFIFRECSAFFGCRLFSGLVDTASMYVMIDLLHCDDFFVKLVVNLLVITLNYSFSRQIVFKDQNQGEVI